VGALPRRGGIRGHEVEIAGDTAAPGRPLRGQDAKIPRARDHKSERRWTAHGRSPDSGVVFSPALEAAREGKGRVGVPGQKTEVESRGRMLQMIGDGGWVV
jgi:hypothetical protein